MKENLNNKKKIKISTAYPKSASFIYDQKRFFDSKGRLFNKLEMKQLNHVLSKFSSVKKILEVGCGTGRFMLKCLQRGHEIHGLDPSPSMIELAKQKCANYKNSYFYIGEGVKLPFKNNFFDFIYCIRTLNQVSSRKYAFKMVYEIIRTCKQDGLILIEFVNKRSLALRRKNKAVRLSTTDIKNIIKEHKGTLKIIKISGILFFSQTVMNHIPIKLLGLFEKIDCFFSKLFPAFSTRCYFLIKKEKSFNKEQRKDKIGIVVPDIMTKGETISGHVQISLMTANILNNNYNVTLITNKVSDKYTLPNFADKNLRINFILPDVFKKWSSSKRNYFEIPFFGYCTTKLMSHFDILHFFGSEKLALLVGIIKSIKRSRARTFFTIYKLKGFRKKIFKILAKKFLGKIDYFLVTTNYIKNELIQIGIKPEKITTIRPGIITNENIKASQNPLISKYKPFVLFWRNADWKNGADICLKTFKHLSRQYPKINFIFATRPGCKYDKEILKINKKYNNIHSFFFPYPEEIKIKDFLLSAKLIVLPFRELSINPQMAILESVMAKVPVITSNIESNNEIIQNQKTGILIYPGVIELTETMEKLLNSPNLAKKIGKSGKKDVQSKWNWQNYEMNLLKFYKKFSKYKYYRK